MESSEGNFSKDYRIAFKWQVSTLVFILLPSTHIREKRVQFRDTRRNSLTIKI